MRPSVRACAGSACSEEPQDHEPNFVHPQTIPSYDPTDCLLTFY